MNDIIISSSHYSTVCRRNTRYFSMTETMPPLHVSRHAVAPDRIIRTASSSAIAIRPTVTIARCFALFFFFVFAPMPNGAAFAVAIGDTDTDTTTPRTLLTFNTAHNFCGSTWGDASENCSERQHCPTASDDECMVPGYACFADTLCDANAGHGAGYLPPYDLLSNVRFCRNPWEDLDVCTREMWCGDGKDCPEGNVCFYSDSCHLHDVMKKEQESEAKELAKAQKDLVAGLHPDDPLRRNSCGKGWDDADRRCGRWCAGEADECPPGEGCYGDTRCYNDVGLVPSPYPTTYEPTTRAPTRRADPSNYRFCGKDWNTTPCTLAAHCPIGTECADGETCYTKQQCNVHDLTRPPSTSPSVSPTLPHDHPSYYRYCGKSAEQAGRICSLRMRCATDDDCGSTPGASCFEVSPERCNAFYMEYPDLRRTFTPTGNPTLRPTGPSQSPTLLPSQGPPTKSPTVRADPINTRFCGTTWDRVDCSLENHCPTGRECKSGQICFTVYQCNVHDLTRSPTPEPTSPPAPTSRPTPPVPTSRPTDRPTTARPTGPSQSPTPPPSASPTTRPPTVREDPTNLRFCGYSWDNVHCSVEAHCPIGSECPGGQVCFTVLGCNIHDLTKTPTSGPTQLLITSSARPTGPTRPPTPQPSARPTTRPPAIREDPMNVRFCGDSWDTVRCSVDTHCPTGSECTGGQMCFTTPRCNIQDLTGTPTSDPTSDPAPQPTAFPITGRNDPINMRFCGTSWDTVVCSLEKYCPNGTECAGGESCISDGHGCNILDMVTTSPRDDPSVRFGFCGLTFVDAVERCSVETRCASEDDCAPGKFCFGNLPGHCDYDAGTNHDTGTIHDSNGGSMATIVAEQPPPPHTPPRRPLRPTRRPIVVDSGARAPGDDEKVPVPESPKRTLRPTRAPIQSNDDEQPFWSMPERTFRPTREPSKVQVDSPAEQGAQPSLWCGKTQSEANNNCGYNFFWCINFKCPTGWECFTVEDRLCKITATAEEVAVESTTTVEQIMIVSRQTRRPTSSPIEPTKRPMNNVPIVNALTRRPTVSSPDRPTKRPMNNVPIVNVSTRRPTVSSPARPTKRPTTVSMATPSTRRPTPEKVITRPVSSIPVKQTIVNYATDLPTGRPMQKPVTSKPAKQVALKPIAMSVDKRPPTSRPVANFLANQPIEMQYPKNNQASPTSKFTTSVSPTIVYYNLLKSSPTSSPMIRAKITVPPVPASSTNKETNSGKPKKPGTLQSTANKSGGITSKENNAEENLNLQSIAQDNAPGKANVDGKPISAVEGLGATVSTTYPNARRRHYCFSQPSNFDEECIDSMECSKGNPCPSGDFCLQFDCENRPPFNGDLDLCPFRLVGTHTKDCKSYYECDRHGYVGPTRTCEEGFKFDKSSGGCLSDFLVDSRCYRSDSYVQSDESFSDDGERSEASLATPMPPSKTSYTIITTPPPTEVHTPLTYTDLWPPTTTVAPSSHGDSATPTFSNTDTTPMTGNPSSSDVLRWETLPNSPPAPPREVKYDLSQWYTNGTPGQTRTSNRGLGYLVVFTSLITSNLH